MNKKESDIKSNIANSLIKNKILSITEKMMTHN